MEEQFVSSRPAVGESSGLGTEAWRFSVKKHQGRKGLGCMCVCGGGFGLGNGSVQRALERI